MTSDPERRIASTRPRRSLLFQRPSSANNQNPNDPADAIAALSLHDEGLNSNPNVLLTPPREGRLSSAAVIFGDANALTNSPVPFTFGQLYNVTPLPSPKPSPGPRIRGGEQCPPSFSLSLQPDLSPGSHGNVDDNERTSTDPPTWSFAQISRRLSDVSAGSAVSPNTNNALTYDVNSEQVPDEPFFDARFQAALVKGKDLAQKVANALAGYHLQSERVSDLKRLWGDAKKLSSFQTSDTRTVAVLGNSGEGKSSLINSLLHCPEIARTGDIGTACTSVVTEYRQKTVEHQAPITIQVEYLSESEIEELMKELIWSYRQLYLPNVEQDASSEEYKRYQAESERAWSALEAAFGHRQEFKKEFLRDQSAEAPDKILTRLLEWTKDLDWPEGGTDGVWKSTAQTAEECCDKTAIFMRDRVWPFTKIIRIYLSAQVLKTGIILADLPGLHDTNLARVKATEQYLLKCDHILTVAGISRAISDQSLKSSLYTALSQYVPNEWETSAGKYLNVSVVCTKTEDINVKTHRKKFCGVGKRIDSATMDALDQQIEQAKNSNNKTLKKELKRRQESLLMTARNDFVKEGLRRNYSEKVPGGILEVFCVSNLNYEKYSKKGVIDQVIASGIPELRRFCHTITAKPQYFEAKNFLQSRLLSVLTSIRLLVEKNRESTGVIDERAKQDVSKAFEDMSLDVRSAIKRTKESFLDSFQEQLLQLMENRNQHWERAAEQKSNEWNQWHTTQYNAWCRNNGTHQTEKRGFVCWNSQIIWKMKTELDYAWDILEEEITELFDDLTRGISNNLGTFKQTVQNRNEASTMASGIEARVRDVAYTLGTTQRLFAREFKTIRRNASEHNYSSYALDGMLPAYRTASLITGTGRTSRQIRTIQSRITDSNLFPLISLSIQNDATNLVTSTFTNISAKVEVMLELIRKDLEMAYGDDHASGVNEGLGENWQTGAFGIQGGRSHRDAEDRDDEGLDDWREGLARQLEGFEEELGEIQAQIGCVGGE